MKILFHDLHWSGHNQNFLEMYLSLGGAKEVVVLGGVKSKAVLKEIQARWPNVTSQEIGRSDSKSLASFLPKRLVAELLSAVQISGYMYRQPGREKYVIVFTTGDNKLLAAMLTKALFGRRVSVIPVFMSLGSSVFSRLALNLVRPIFKRAILLTPGSEYIDAAPDNFIKVVDPAESAMPAYPIHLEKRPDCYLCQEIPSETVAEFDFDLVVYGALTRRKNTDYLARIIEAAEDLGVRLRLGTFGAVPDSDFIGHDRVEKLASFGSCVTRRLSTVEEAHLLTRTRMVWVGYNGTFTTSGVQRLFGYGGTPCVAIEGCGLDVEISGHGLGVVVDRSDPRAAAEQLLATLTSQSARRSASANCRDYFRKSDPRAFVAAIDYAIKKVAS